jgi:hypothetical protein
MKMNAKIVMCLLTMLCIIAGHVLAEEIYIENHSFEEPGDGKTHGWDEADGAYYVEGNEPAEVPGWESEGEVEDSGVSYETDNVPIVWDGLWYGYLMGDDPPAWQLTDHVIATGEVFTLTFDAYSVWDGPEIQANLYYDDSGTRVVVASGTVTDLEQDNEDAPVVGTVVFTAYDAPESIGHNIGIEFDNPLDDDDFQYGSWTSMDNVHLTVDLTYANAIYPPKDGTNILLDIALEWYLEEGYTCDLYFGTQGDPNVYLNPKVIDDEVATTYDPPGDLDYDTTYYWRVDTIDPNDGIPTTIPGITWSFRTITEYVVILGQPENVTVAPGGTAEFSVDAASVTAISYEWFKVNKGAGGDISVSTDEVLTITNAQLEDEGDYYCILTNDKGPVTSETCRLMTERLVGWWKLDGDLSDSVGLEVAGAPTHFGDVVGDDPDYVAGIDGSAVDFLSDGRIVLLRDSSDYFNFYPQGMTVSAWVKSDTDEKDAVVSKQLLAEESTGWHAGIDYPDGAYFTGHPEGELSGTEDDGDIFDGEWHLITAVIDPSTQTNRIYVDGVVRQESDPYDFGEIAANEEPVVFGAENQEDSSSYTGHLDDVRIWNYPLGTIDIAMLYLDFNPDKDVCLYQDDAWLQLDYAGDPGEPSYCKIDIEDFAEFASAWLDCHLVPTCLP